MMIGVFHNEREKKDVLNSNFPMPMEICLSMGKLEYRSNF